MMTIKLKGADGKERAFSFLQAEALLRGEVKMKHGNWSLPEDSKYEFIDNGLIRRTSKKTNTRKTESSGTGSGDKARVEADAPLRDDS